MLLKTNFDKLQELVKIEPGFIGGQNWNLNKRLLSSSPTQCNSKCWVVVDNFFWNPIPIFGLCWKPGNLLMLQRELPPMAVIHVFHHQHYHNNEYDIQPIRVVFSFYLYFFIFVCKWLVHTYSQKGYDYNWDWSLIYLAAD